MYRIPFYIESSSTRIILYTFSIFSFLYVLITLFDVSTTIPGYQPVIKSEQINEEQFMAGNYVKQIKSKTIPLRHCFTCKIIRNIRSYHCNICNRCIERHDHHCGFVANCIGKHNTGKFLLFILSIVIHSCILCSSSAVAAVKSYILDLTFTFKIFVIYFVKIFSGAFFCVMGIFLLLHIYLVLNNKTTNELIRNRYDPKIFDNGWKLNCLEAFDHNSANIEDEDPE